MASNIQGLCYPNTFIKHAFRRNLCRYLVLGVSFQQTSSWLPISARTQKGTSLSYKLASLTWWASTKGNQCCCSCWCSRPWLVCGAVCTVLTWRHGILYTMAYSDYMHVSSFMFCWEWNEWAVLWCGIQNSYGRDVLTRNRSQTWIGHSIDLAEFNKKYYECMIWIDIFNAPFFM